MPRRHRLLTALLAAASSAYAHGALGAPPAGRPADRVEPAQPAREDRTLSGTRGGLGLVPFVSLGFLPAVSAGASAGMTFRGGSTSLGVEVRALASQTTHEGASIRTMSARSQVTACGYRGYFALCGLFGVGGLEVLDDPTIQVIEARSPWTATVGLRPGAAWRFSEHLALHGFVELHAVLGQPSIWVNNQEFWSAPPVAALLGLGVMLPFGGREAHGKE